MEKSVNNLSVLHLYITRIIASLLNAIKIN